MKLLPLTVASLLLAVTATQAAENSKPRSFRWVDAKGVVHYGDAVPPEYSGSQTSELNRQGVEIQSTPAQLSPGDRISAEEKAAAIAREKQRDQVLLSTYVSVHDIEQLRDERMGLIDAQIVAAQGFLAAAESRMKTLETRAKNFRPYATAPTSRRMPDQLADEIVRTVNEERAQRTVMVQKRSEKDTLRTRFQSDIERFQVLVAQRPTAAR
jgi:hypothetical protein